MEIPQGDTYYFKFTTRAFATGIPTTLAGTPVISVYEENNLTQITAGITLTADYDSVTGLNDVAVVATSGNGYEIGKYYNAVITTGTVGGVSVVGETVGHFRVMPPEDASAGVKDVNLTHYGDTAGTFSGGRPEVNSSHFAGTAYATALASEIDAVWDEVLTGATHNVNNSAGKRLRQIDAAFEVHSGTAQAGTATTITLDTGASASNDIYRGDRIIIVEGTGVQEHGICISYNGTTKVATMAETWIITPDATSLFEVVPASVDVETWQHNVVTASASGLPDVNVNEVGDTAQTAGDLAGLITGLNDVAATDIVSSGAITTLAGAVVNVDLVDTLTTYTGNTPQTADHTAGIADIPTVAEFEARTPTAAQLAYIVSNSADGKPVTFTGGTTTTAVLGNVDGVAASSTDDVYNGRVLVFNSGTLDEQATDITDYVGATKTATITAVTTSVTASHTANLK